MVCKADIETGDLVEFSGEYYIRSTKAWTWSADWLSGIVVGIKYERALPRQDFPSRIVSVHTGEPGIIEIWADKSYTAVRKASPV